MDCEVGYHLLKMNSWKRATIVPHGWTRWRCSHAVCYLIKLNSSGLTENVFFKESASVCWTWLSLVRNTRFMYFSVISEIRDLGSLRLVSNPKNQHRSLKKKKNTNLKKLQLIYVLYCLLGNQLLVLSPVSHLSLSVHLLTSVICLFLLSNGLVSSDTGNIWLFSPLAHLCMHSTNLWICLAWAWSIVT